MTPYTQFLSDISGCLIYQGLAMPSWQNCKCNKSDFQAMVCCSVGFLMPAKCLLRPCWIIFANFFCMSSSHCFLALGFAIIQPNAFSRLVRSICGYNAILGKMNKLKKTWTHISGLTSRPHFHSGLNPVKITTTGFRNRLDYLRRSNPTRQPFWEIAGCSGKEAFSSKFVGVCKFSLTLTRQKLRPDYGLRFYWLGISKGYFILPGALSFFFFFPLPSLPSLSLF